MKTGTPTVKKIGTEAIFAGSAVLGGAASEGVVGLLPQSKFTKLGLTVLSTIAAAAIKGTDEKATAARGLLAGMAIRQGLNAAQDALAPMVSEYVAANPDSKIAGFLSRATGLGGPGVHYPAILPSPSLYQEPQYEQLGTPNFPMDLPLGV